MDTQPITLEVSLDELNKILTALGNLPYLQVYDLIHSIREQAESQLQKKNTQTNGVFKETINS